MYYYSKSYLSLLLVQNSDDLRQYGNKKEGMKSVRKTAGWPNGPIIGTHLSYCWPEN